MLLLAGRGKKHRTGQPSSPSGAADKINVFIKKERRLKLIDT